MPRGCFAVETAAAASRPDEMPDLVQGDEVADLAADRRDADLEPSLATTVAVPHPDHNRTPPPVDPRDPVGGAEVVDVAVEGPRLHAPSVEITLEVTRPARCCQNRRVPGTSPRIRAARLDDLELLVEIERAAGEVFRSVGLDVVADDDPGSVAELTPYAAGGRAFVAVDGGDRPVGYLLLDVVDDAAHVEQVSVHPDDRRQGIGSALIRRAETWGRDNGFDALTLTAYLAVPWNGPYYERLGFRVLEAGEETPGLRAIREHERTHGLDAAPRACMRRRLD